MTTEAINGVLTFLAILFLLIDTMRLKARIRTCENLVVLQSQTISKLAEMVNLDGESIKIIQTSMLELIGIMKDDLKERYKN
jgi:uncharacterized coiled-coil protein SlyX